MTVETQILADRTRYADVTRENMTLAATALEVMQDFASEDHIAGVVSPLESQASAAKRAGFEGISRLCRDMVDFLEEARDERRPRQAVVASRISDICQTIQLHANAVGRCGMPELV